MSMYHGEETSAGYNHAQFELKPTAHVAFTFAPHTHFAVNTGINATADINFAAKNSFFDSAKLFNPNAIIAKKIPRPIKPISAKISQYMLCAR